MNRGSLRLEEYLKHIIEAIDGIQTYCEDMSEVSFLSSQITQDAVIRNFEIIGEASKNIERVATPEFLALNSDLPLSFAYDTRNLLAQGYYSLRAFPFALRYAQTSQFSASTPGYFSKSFRLLVTTVTDNAFACAAINLSR